MLQRMFLAWKGLQSLEGCVDLVGKCLHFLGRELELGLAEIHVALGLHGDEVDVGMGNFQTKNGYSHLCAGNYLFEGHGHLLGKHMKVGKGLVVEVEDIVGFFAGNDKGMSVCYGIDVEEGIETFVLRTFERGYFAGGDFAEYAHI